MKRFTAEYVVFTALFALLAGLGIGPYVASAVGATHFTDDDICIEWSSSTGDCSLSVTVNELIEDARANS